MISLEQVQLLESRVVKAVEYVERLKTENTALSCDRERLQLKLDKNQKRLDELEVLVMRFKEDQGRIEDGIIAALDRLSQFEEAFESSLKETASAGSSAKKNPVKGREKPAEHKSSSEEFFEISQKEADTNADELDIF